MIRGAKTMLIPLAAVAAAYGVMVGLVYQQPWLIIGACLPTGFVLWAAWRRWPRG